MPTQPPTACRRCGKVAESGSICKACKPAQQESIRARERWHNDDPISRLYHNPRWIKLSKLLRDLNPICLHIINGQQCRYPSKLVHHKVSPRTDKSLFYTVSNLVPICRGCHTDDPGEMRGYLYAPTKWLMGTVYEHTAPALVLGTPEWFEVNRPR